MVPMGLVDASGGTGRTLPPPSFATEAISPSTRGSQRSFAGHSLAAREAGRRGANLRAEVERPLAGGRERRNRSGFRRCHRKRCGRLLRVGGLPRAEAALPRDKRAPEGQERRRVFEEDPQWGERPCGDDVLAREPLVPGFGPPGNDLDVVELERSSGALEERALARDALDESDPRVR